MKEELMRKACEIILRDAENADIDIGLARANMLRRALDIEEVVYSEFHQRILKCAAPLLNKW